MNAVGQSGEWPDWDAERRSSLQRRVNQLQACGLLPSPPEDVNFIRYVGPDEVDDLYLRELRRHGIAASDVGSLDPADWDCPEPQLEAAAGVLFRCWVQYPIHPGYDHLPFTSVQLRALYDYYVESLSPCLLAAGHDPGPVPPYEYFAAHVDTSTAWSPYALITSKLLWSGRDEELRALRRRCRIASRRAPVRVGSTCSGSSP